MPFRSVAVLALLASACVVAGGPGERTACPSETLLPWTIATQDLATSARAGDVPRLRVTSYNIHSGLGSRFAPWRSRAVVERNLRAVATDIAEAGPAPDVVALNEVDFAARRSGGIDEAAFLASELGRRVGSAYQVAPLETWHRTLPGFEVRFGNALLVRHRIVESVGEPFPLLPTSSTLGRFLRERRGVLRVTLDVDGRLVDVLVTHLEAFVQSEREAQARHLLRRFVSPERPTILAGDVNAVPTVLTGGRRFFGHDRTHDILTSGGLADTRLTWAAHQGVASLAAWATFPADQPIWPLDAVLTSAELAVLGIDVIGGMASDHRGLVVDLTLVRDPALVVASRERHDAMRRRQLSRILDCDVGRGGTAGGWRAALENLIDVATPAQRTLLEARVPGLFALALGS
jgi:endonuclease/exonuclease/phosphatase family metal-dependent hydrolase